MLLASYLSWPTVTMFSLSPSTSPPLAPSSSFPAFTISSLSPHHWPLSSYLSWPTVTMLSLSSLSFKESSFSCSRQFSKYRTWVSWLHFASQALKIYLDWVNPSEWLEPLPQTPSRSSQRCCAAFAESLEVGLSCRSTRKTTRWKYLCLKEDIKWQRIRDKI